MTAKEARKLVGTKPNRTFDLILKYIRQYALNGKTEVQLWYYQHSSGEPKPMFDDLNQEVIDKLKSYGYEVVEDKVVYKRGLFSIQEIYTFYTVKW